MHLPATEAASPTHTPDVATAGPAGSRRLESLDAYRGLIMLTLLCGAIFHSLEGHPTWHWLAVQNEHMAWEGAVYWDLIQPAFMFMVGVAMPLAFARRSALGQPWRTQAGHAVRRALALIAIGIALDHIGAERVQVGFIRVLQQIAFGYVAAFFVLGRSLRTQGAVALAILGAYQLIWMFNPWNGAGGPWAMGNENIGSAFDFWLLGRHYSWYYVGLNAVPSTATIIFGVMAGTVLRDGREKPRAAGTLLAAALAGIAVGLAVSPWFPLIKRTWTPSFAIYSAGWTTLLLVAFYWVVEIKGWRRWAFPLVVVGMNSIAAYVLANAFAGWFRGATGAWTGLLRPAVGDNWLPVLQHALFASTAWGVLYWLYRRKVFFKV